MYARTARAAGAYGGLGADFDKYRGRVPPPRTPAQPLDTLHPHERSWRESQGIAEVRPVWPLSAASGSYA